MKSHILIRKYITEALRDEITNIEIDPEKEKEFFRKAEENAGLTYKSSEIGFRQPNLDRHNANAQFNKWKSMPQFQEIYQSQVEDALKDIERNKRSYANDKDLEKAKEDAKENILNRMKNNFIVQYISRANSASNRSDRDAEVEKLISAFRNKFVTQREKDKFAARVKNYEGINFKIFTIPTNINLIDLLKKVQTMVPSISENSFSEGGLGITAERTLTIGDGNKNNQELIGKLVEGLIKFQLLINSSKKDASSIDKFKAGLQRLFQGDVNELKKNGELFEIISVFEKIHENIEKNQEDCHIIVYGISNVDDVSFARSTGSTIYVVRSPWMTMHRLFDTGNDDFFRKTKKPHLRPDLIFFKYSEYILDFFSRLGNLGYKMYIELLKKQNFDLNLTDKFSFNIDFKNQEERDKFEKFNHDLLKDSSIYPILPKGIENNDIPRNRFFKNIFANGPDKKFFDNESVESRTLTRVFKFQKINADTHAINMNSDFVNELMTYLLGILKNKSGENYNIVSKASGKEEIQKSLNIEELVEHMFLTELNSFLKENMNEEYSKFKKEVMIPMVEEIIELLDVTMDYYKGKVVLIGK